MKTIKPSLATLVATSNTQSELLELTLTPASSATVPQPRVIPLNLPSTQSNLLKDFQYSGLSLPDSKSPPSSPSETSPSNVSTPPPIPPSTPIADPSTFQVAVPHFLTPNPSEPTTQPKHSGWLNTTPSSSSMLDAHANKLLSDVLSFRCVASKRRLITSLSFSNLNDAWPNVRSSAWTSREELMVSLVSESQDRQVTVSLFPSLTDKEIVLLRKMSKPPFSALLLEYLRILRSRKSSSTHYTITLS